MTASELFCDGDGDLRRPSLNSREFIGRKAIDTSHGALVLPSVEFRLADTSSTAFDSSDREGGILQVSEMSPRHNVHEE